MAIRLFADGRFYHPDRKARFVPTPPRAPAHLPDSEYPLVLNTGRIRDQWHTMTRTGRSPRLTQHLPEPFIDLHPEDALLYGLREAELGRVATRWGSLVARVRCSAETRRGEIFVPIHWSGPHASDARVGALVNPAVDPISGEPEFKHTPARVEAFPVDWHAFALSRQPLKPEPAAWWVRIQGARFLRYELAGRHAIGDPAAWARALLCADEAEADWLDYRDAAAGIYRAAQLVEGRIESCVFASPRPDLPLRAWLAGLFAKERLDEADRIGLLMGTRADAQPDPGPTVCSCFGVGRNTIVNAIRKQGLKTAPEIGRCLKAGTNCGSCVPELQALLQSAAAA